MNSGEKNNTFITDFTSSSKHSPFTRLMTWAFERGLVIFYNKRSGANQKQGWWMKAEIILCGLFARDDV